MALNSESGASPAARRLAGGGHNSDRRGQEPSALDAGLIQGFEAHLALTALATSQQLARDAEAGMEITPAHAARVFAAEERKQAKEMRRMLGWLALAGLLCQLVLGVRGERVMNENSAYTTVHFTQGEIYILILCALVAAFGLYGVQLPVMKRKQLPVPDTTRPVGGPSVAAPVSAAAGPAMERPAPLPYLQKGPLRVSQGQQVFTPDRLSVTVLVSISNASMAPAYLGDLWLTARALSGQHVLMAVEDSEAELPPDGWLAAGGSAQVTLTGFSDDGFGKASPVLVHYVPADGEWTGE